MKLLTTVTPLTTKKRVVRVLLPRKALRPILFHHAHKEWLLSSSLSFVWTNTTRSNYSADHHVSLALWTLLQLVVVYNKNDDGDNDYQTSNYWKQLCQFTVECLPPVPTPVRSWFIDRAISNVVVHSFHNHPLKSDMPPQDSKRSRLLLLLLLKRPPHRMRSQWIQIDHFQHQKEARDCCQGNGFQ